MTPERWQRVNEIFYAALAQDARERAAFLAEACAGDQELLAEVESLLAAHAQPGDFIDAPAYEVAAELLVQAPARSLAGEQLGAYRILNHLGAGVMGEVYLAEDTRLGRQVAVKLLPAEFTTNPERLRRFEREARTTSALNHPNIITIYEIAEVGGIHFIATEFVAGETLRGRMAEGAMKLNEALDVTTQIASALAAAHAAGVVHRDIKPENVMVRPDGLVKVLDFGLAKLTEASGRGGERGRGRVREGESGRAGERESERQGEVKRSSPTPSLSHSPALPLSHSPALPLSHSPAPSDSTAPGVVMGTFNYMSPEQARGLQVDAHTDIFSLGVVTHEMIAGQAPFAGETPSDVIAALLTGSPPPLRQYRAEVPAELERIVVKALRKDREERYQSSEELLADLQSFKQEWEFKARLSDSAASEATRPARFLMAVIAGRDRGWPAALIILLAATALMLVAAAGVYFWRADRQAADAGAIKSIAVLPFKTIGAKSEEEFLGLGMADVLITRLSRTGKLAVSPTEAVRRYGEKGSDPLATGHALGVAAVLTGNVQQSGDRLRVTVQLLRVGDGLPVWADQFDERLTDIFTLQDQISQRLAGALTLKLTGDERRRLTENQTASVEAYQLYLEGRYYWARRTPEWVRKAIVCFEQSARLDPNYAQAYAGLADSYAITASGLPPQERLPKAKAAAERALALDESLAEAHTSLAFILYKFEWNWLEAENHFRRALELNPNYSIGQHWFGECLALMGRFDEGLARLHEAERLDPLSLSIKNDLGRALYRARRYDEAIAQARKTLELAPDFRNAHWTIMYACEQQGRLAEAVEADLQALRLSKVAPARIEELRAAFAASGWAGYWRRQLAQTRERARNEYVPAYFFAEIHMRLGNQEAAFRALEKSYEELGDGPLFVRVEPPLDALRSDLRFAHFLRRSGLDGR